MSWQDLFTALALFLVLEGIMPFVSPAQWRRTLQLMIQMSESTLRTIGLISMLSGLTVLYIVR